MEHGFKIGDTVRFTQEHLDAAYPPGTESFIGKVVSLDEGHGKRVGVQWFTDSSHVGWVPVMVTRLELVTPPSALTPRDYCDAINVQYACNLSGIVHSFSRVMEKICKDVDNTDERNTHPIAVLYASKISSLTNAPYTEDFCNAYETCTARSKGE